ncbi:hypothetical protein F4861DRAFT_199754 [Xylaria intraflava]|nr:hypothetical protein F4861DRAFT_199754 [Xylaria intraflava]
MADTNPRPTGRQTIGDYSLVRRTSYFSYLTVDFMSRYVDPDGSAKDSWVGFAVEDTRYLNLNTYAVSPQLNAYVTMSVFLTYGDDIGDRRITPMRYRDMMVDNYLAAGGDLKTWRYIGVHSIVHNPTVKLIEKSFRETRGGILEASTMEYTPDTPGFQDVAYLNPFTRGIMNLLQQYKEETGRAKVKRFIFVSMGLPQNGVGWDLGPELHMLVELCRPGEEGYDGE